MNKEWLDEFWKKHGERLVFTGMVLGLAGGFWFLPDLKESAKTLFIGIAMLYYNKARGGGGGEGK